MTKAEPRVVEDFDAFWATQSSAADRPQVRIRGQVVDVPFDLPLDLATRIQDADSSDEETSRALVAEMYGPGTLDAWIAAGMGGKELFTVLAWTFLRAQGQEVTFAEAAEKTAEAVADPAMTNGVVVPNREERRAADKAGKGATTRSGRTGGSSSRTSAASTASPRRASRR